MAERGPATLHDVAREAGVSLATASRVLNGSARVVAEDYRQRVLAAADRLQYSPNLVAQAVVRGSTRTVALLVADISDPYFAVIAAGVAAAAEEEGLIVTIGATGREPERELDVVRAIRGQRPRILVLAGSRRVADPVEQELRAELEAVERVGGRVVLISATDLPFRTVQVANRAGAAALAAALADRGYRRFAILAGAAGLIASDERVEGFRAELNERGIRVADANVVRAEFTRDGGFDAMSRLLNSRRGEFDLVFAANDVMAVGAMSALRQAGLTPGRDVAVAGFDDVPTALDVTPSLTTVRIPLVEIGRRAVRAALDDAPAGGLPDPEVVLRDSTPPLR